MVELRSRAARGGFCREECSGQLLVNLFITEFKCFRMALDLVVACLAALHEHHYASAIHPRLHKVMLCGVAGTEAKSEL